MINKIVVVGAGTMGAGIAFAAAQHHFKVLLFDINEKMLPIAKQQVDNNLDYLLKKETITQASQNRSLEIRYPSFKEEKGMFLPNEINIKAEQKDKVTIDIEYKNTTFNENLSYSYAIPSGYKAIEID